METAKGVNQPMDESTNHARDGQMDQAWDEPMDETWAESEDEPTDEAWDDTTYETWDDSPDDRWDEPSDDRWDEPADERWDAPPVERPRRERVTTPKAAPSTPPPHHQPPDHSGWRGRFRGRNLIWVGAGVLAAVLIGNYLARGFSGGGSNPANTGQTPSSQTATTPIPNTSIGLNAPIVLLNPGIVKPGTAVTINGYGFGHQTIADLVIKQGPGSAGKPVGAVRTDQTGSFATTVDLPQGMIAGPFTLEAHQRNSTKSADATGSVSAGAAFVKMGAVVGKVGDNIGWTGTGFAPGEKVNVYWNALGGQPLATYHADQGGGVKATVQVPFSAIGENSFIFMGTQSQSPVTAPFLVLKLYPNVKPTSYALHADDPISFSGTGFGPNERVLIFLNSTNGPPLAVAQADGHGAFKNAGTMVIPFSFKGKQTILFVGEQSRSLTKLGFSVLPYLPHAQASTYGGMPGTTISFYAYDFAKNELVHVYTNAGSGGGGTEVACFQTNGQGAAGAQGSYMIPAGAQGKMTFTLVGSLSGASTTATLTVTPSNVPIQVPPQKPFTCPLHQAPPQEQIPVAPQAPDQNAGQNNQPQAPDQNQQPQAQPQAPDQNAGQNNQQQPPDQNGGQGNQAPSSSTGAPQAQRAHSSQTASLLLFAGLVGIGGMTTSRTSGGSDSAATAAQTMSSEHPPVAGSVAANASDQLWVRFLGLLWLVSVVMLSVLAYVRARISKKALTRGLPTAGRDASGRPSDLAAQPSARAPLPAAQAGMARGVTPGAADAELAPDVPRQGRRGARAAPDTLQRLPVVLANGEPGVVPQVAGVTGAGRARRSQAHTDGLLMRIGHVRLNGSVQPYALCAVADGMGADASERREASSLALRMLEEHVASRMTSDASTGAVSFPIMLMEALTWANADLYTRNVTAHAAAGTTVTAALLTGNTVYIVNVGDSRAYVYSPLRGLRQITMDHSIVAALVATQLLSPDAAYTHPRRNQIYRCLGRQADVRVDGYQITLEPEDRILLCSNGLWTTVRDPQIAGILHTTPDPYLAADQLVATANRNGASESATVIVARTLHDYVMREAHPDPQMHYAKEDASDLRDKVSPGHPPDRG